MSLPDLTRLLLVSLLPWAAVSAQERSLVGGSPTCGACRIVLSEPTVLEGPAVEGEPMALARLPDGRFLASYYPGGDVLWTFSADGRESERFATTGQGPGEVSYVTRVQGLGPDSIVVFEAGNARATVFTVDGGVGRTFRLPGRVFDSAPLPGGRFVTNGSIPSAEHAGRPLQILDVGGGILTSFGATEGRPMRPDLPHLAYRRLASDRAGRIWSAMPTSYEIAEWSAAGNAVRVWVRDAPWFPDSFEGRAIDPAEEFPPWLVDVEVVDSGHLATVTLVGSADWRDHLGEPFTIPGSGRVVYPDWDVSRVHDSIVELMDVETGRVFATGRFPGYAVGFVDGGHLAFYEQDAVGEPRITIHELRVGPR